ncbi:MULTISPECIES: O-antigen ligase family protein [Aliivibrio]|uniref:O-antigen ligase family protein n=1 Tax=Aliivibrio finisterrensis TaxID=511998 RepID=A0A4Q5KM09_9GAMM|nr:MULTISPECIES: O-antigen ligase family protein [Aliivibrio]MDD9179616.1 O-antigen ligase family protein [Aliivibrio sp. A6]RYU47473.1 O-antigen ligase family protein [Aliivibrio finisterrensis]RYU49456.1 O-antigen ligase family protein [Aliivibrio finisterrensis]RYU57071.1 O-antigen ligase family protein [Aliivibrio finisterrensis]RYU61815.1 O-antigen ligase family protein [Aliivibrio finisterrensis]
MQKIHLPFIATILCFLFFSTPIIYPDSYVVAPILLALFGLFLLPKTYQAFKIKDVKCISLAMIGYFILTIVSLLYSGGETSQLDMPSRTVLASFILCFLVTYKPNPIPIFLAAPIGATIAGLISLYQSFYVGGRAFIDTFGYMPIQIGGIIASLATFSVISFFYYRNTQQQHLAIFSFIATSLGYIATLLSGARGAWVLTPFIFLVILFLNREFISKKIIAAAGFAIAIVFTAAYPQISARFDAMQSDLSDYSVDNSSTSVGARLEMWKSALYSAQESPLFGQGFSGVEAAKKRQIEKGLIDSTVLTFSRAHNQFFEDLQTKGVLGLSVLIIMFAVPFAFFKRNLKRDKPNTDKDAHYFLALMGTSHVALVAGYALTQHYLSHHSGILFFAVGIAILSALVINQRKPS